jgi:hypothetical protein
LASSAKRRLTQAQHIGKGGGGCRQNDERKGIGSLSDLGVHSAFAVVSAGPCEPGGADSTGAALSVCLPGWLGFRPSKINNPLI